MVARVGHGGGLNCTLKYQITPGKWRGYRLRAVSLTHGVTMIADEGKSRTGRAYYPHQRSQAQFMITFALLARKKVSDHSEYERFNVWLREYMNLLLDPDFSGTHAREMEINIPVRNFHRHGVPLGPIKFGERVGSMVWNQMITFETFYEPGDKRPPVSRFVSNGTEKDRNAAYFYPSSRQLSANEKPVTYDVPVDVPTDRPTDAVPVPSPTQVGDAVRGPRSPRAVEAEEEASRGPLSRRDAEQDGIGGGLII